MIIENIKSINKNSLKSIFSLKIPIPGFGNFIIRDCSYFESNGKRWINFPCRSYEDKGEKKYFSYNLFEKKEDQQKFMQLVLDAFTESNRDLPLEKNEDLPF